ncbi:Zinc finger C2HC domain-containing protein 1A [Lamellibrachia satsuma]|nr:Zinc finger C2HC domain-containing protein 1A [Lamellibrachia satsuma]
MAFQADDDLALKECSICGRRFNIQSLKRHEPICLKASQKPRKVFDSAKQRIDGTDAVIAPKTSTIRSKKTSSVQPRKSTWKEQHEEFISTIRAARGVQAAMQSGKPLPPPPAPSLNPDYVQCPYCDRRFNANAAERHIPFCKTQHDRLPKKKPDMTAKARMEIRTQYKAPRLKGQASGSGYGQGRTTRDMTAMMADQGAMSNHGRTIDKSAVKTASSAMTASCRTQAYKTSGGHDSPDSGRIIRNSRTIDMDLELRQSGTRQRPTKPRKMGGDNLGSSMKRSMYNDPTEYHDEGIRSRNGRSNSDYREENYRTGGDVAAKRGSKSSPSRFCHDCGAKFPMATAKFCCECGVRRLGVS